MTRGAHKTVPNPAFWSGYIDCDGCRLLPDAKAGRRSGQCLARASATHLLIALCCAHKDISLYFACSFTSARQVAVACFTAALSGWSAAFAKVGSRKKAVRDEYRECPRHQCLPLLKTGPCDSFRNAM